ncbi:MAG TPA: YggS family pyridoxal phosphate-dependent enzyme [Micavibrio sp.]|nr:YggS family pyridoxal phosphate-dependent enzyme [Micavibrio sp.]
MSDIAENFDAVLKKIRKAERAAGREEEGAVKLVAASKMQSEDNLRAALACGHRLFGENKVQEAQAHWTHLRQDFPDLKLHLIGPLQTNKAADAVALFDCIETVDREKLADALASEMAKQGRRLPCFIQVNTGEEEQKAGISPEELPALLAYCRKCGLEITGLMCIPPIGAAPALHFALLKNLAAENGLAHLSMGMSADFEKAVALGATYVRVGTALFGERA